jgi:O-antigen/teichoic acid export membrane protein
LSVKRHAGYNLLGSVIPIGLSLLTVPLYLKLVGPDRYGVLAIAWLLLGYFGLFDLGLGRATSFRIASQRDATAEARATTFWSALLVNVTMGFIGGLVLWGAAFLFFGHIFKVREALRPEILAAVPFLAASVPVATVTGVLTGTLQGREKFLETNIVSVLSTTLFQLLPLSVAFAFGPRLPLLLAATISARLIAVAVLAYRCYREVAYARRPAFHGSEVSALLKYGGWVSLTSIFGPMLVIVDRFAIGAVLGAVAVAAYTVPFQLAQRIAILPAALTNALFPRMSAAEPAERDSLARRATLTLACLISPLILGALLLLEPFLRIWIGPDMATASAPTGRILVIGFWANAFALVPFTRLQASGRPDVVTKLLLVQIPPYLLALYLAMTYLGLVGGALVFSARCIVDFVLQSLAAGRRIHSPLPLLGNFLMLVVAANLPLHDAIWWIAAAGLVTASFAFNWTNLPADLKQRGIAQLRWRFWKHSA